MDSKQFTDAVRHVTPTSVLKWTGVLFVVVLEALVVAYLLMALLDSR